MTGTAKHRSRKRLIQLALKTFVAVSLGFAYLGLETIPTLTWFRPWVHNVMLAILLLAEIWTLLNIHKICRFFCGLLVIVFLLCAQVYRIYFFVPSKSETAFYDASSYFKYREATGKHEKQDNEGEY